MESVLDSLARLALGGLVFFAVMLVGALMRVRNGSIVVVGVGRRRRFAWAGGLLVVAVTLSVLVLVRSSFELVEATVKLGLLTVVLSLTLTGVVLGESDWLTAKYPKIWVKALDFPYLVLGFGGVVRVLNTSPHVERAETIDVFGLVLLAAALGVRLTKATLEVFFDKFISGEYEWVDKNTRHTDEAATKLRP